MVLGGLVLLQLGGAALRFGLAREPWAVGLRSPTSAAVGLAAAFLASLDEWGLLPAAAVGVALWLSRGGERPRQVAPPWLGLGGLVALVLARPWVPTFWDELVWLGKARFESLGFGQGVAAALDPASKLIPSGYPPLWPAAVGWLSLGRDALDAHVLGASVLVVLSLACALEAWWPRLQGQRWWVLMVLAATPLVWVHLRATYVDLPVGLFGAAFLGRLLAAAEAPSRRAGVEVFALALVLAGIKDEGLAHVVAATLGVLATKPQRGSWRLGLPAAVALAVVVLWRALCAWNGVSNVDHALHAPYWPWVPTLLKLLALHASDVGSWGVFWAVALAALVRAPSSPHARAVRVMLAANFAFTAVALVCGPERVRVFAENGTLLNRVLLQVWPVAAIAVVSALAWQPKAEPSSSPVPA